MWRLCRPSRLTVTPLDATGPSTVHPVPPFRPTVPCRVVRAGPPGRLRTLSRAGVDRPGGPVARTAGSAGCRGAQQDLAEMVAGLQDAVRLGGLGYRQDPVHDRADGAGLDQWPHLLVHAAHD